MKTVLCYGDSNTWGAATVDRPDGRYGPEERWTGVMAAELGPGWRVIEEGLNGRTTVSDDPVEGAERNGRRYLLPCLQSHWPLDAVILMLGTNDLKARFNKRAGEIAEGVGALLDDLRDAGREPGAGIGRGGGQPVVLVVAPPPVREDLKAFAEMFHGAYEKSLALADACRAVAEARGVHFFDAGTVIASGAADGIHLDPDAHAVLGRVLAERLAAIAP